MVAEDELPLHVRAKRAENARLALLLGNVASDVEVPGIRGAGWRVATGDSGRATAIRSFVYDDGPRRGAAVDGVLVTVKSTAPDGRRSMSPEECISWLTASAAEFRSVVDAPALVPVSVDGRVVRGWSWSGRSLVTVLPCLGGVVGWATSNPEHAIKAVHSEPLDITWPKGKE